MDKSIKEIFNQTVKVVLESIFILTETITKVIGRMICTMEKELRLTKMDQGTKAIGLLMKRMDREFL